MGFFRRKPVTIRTVQKGKDGMWYVYRLSMFGNWRLASHGYHHSTSAWAKLGHLTAEEQQEDEQ